ncbi:MAG: DUF58 domain-containing protein, partial [Lachnospiraceae bacterium]|nr:DUF58 domain-containing protein [Lachnospiraceae bacterium]
SNSYNENSRLKQDFDAAVRDYIPGDPPKGIHRKLSAKTGKLKSRLTFGEERQGIAIFLDTDRVSDNEYEFIPVENKALEIVLALVDYYAKRSIMSTLRFYRPGSAGNSVRTDNYVRNNTEADNSGNNVYTGSYGRNSMSAGSSGISGAGLEEIKCTGVNGMEAFLAQVSAIQFRNTPESSAVAGMISQDPVFRNSLVVFMVVTGSCRELNETLNELSLSGVTTVIYYVGYEPDTGSILALQNQTVIPVHPEDDLVNVMQ